MGKIESKYVEGEESKYCRNKERNSKKVFAIAPLLSAVRFVTVGDSVFIVHRGKKESLKDKIK